MINYYLLMKPGIILGNLFTVAAGFFLASKGTFNVVLFLMTLLGLALVMASACIFNNYIDRQIDKKMERTKQRALVTGAISVSDAMVLASLLGIIGGLFLFFYTNLLTTVVAGIGFVVYVVLYSLWKCRTIYGTAIGSIAGATPPVVGYCAVSNHFDLGALILFVMMVLWQMPHFFSIAIWHFDDYMAAGIPVLPIKRGTFRTKVHMLAYIVSFTAVAMLLPWFHYTGYLYLAVAMGGGCIWLWLCSKGFNEEDEQTWGRSMFRMSLVLITALCVAIMVK